MSIEYVRGANDGIKRRVHGHGKFYYLSSDPQRPTHQVCDLELDGGLVTTVVRMDRIEREKQ